MKAPQKVTQELTLQFMRVNLHIALRGNSLAEEFIFFSIACYFWIHSNYLRDGHFRVNMDRMTEEQEYNQLSDQSILGWC